MNPDILEPGFIAEGLIFSDRSRIQLVNPANGWHRGYVFSR
jgi:hypothetical protein